MYTHDPPTVVARFPGILRPLESVSKKVTETIL